MIKDKDMIKDKIFLKINKIKIIIKIKSKNQFRTVIMMKKITNILLKHNI